MFLGMGIDGVLIALTCTIYVGAIFPFIYFARKNNKSYLHLVSPSIAFKNENPNSIALLIKASINGSSETVQDIAISLVSLLCIYQINVFYGDDGIVAYGVTEYAWLVFNSLFIGFSMATAPLMSYQQGAKNKLEMHSLFKNCIIIIVIFSVVSFAISQLCAEPLVILFVGYSKELVDFSIYVFRIYAISFMFFGISIYGSSLFTSLGNGLISALIAFLRTVVFEVIALIILPMIFAGDGIWYAAIFAEIMSAILTIIFIITKGKKYGILKKG
ncbi:MAG: MATE family efflux transporter [Coriobacteriia bacterium]|nr:MATE family efflux transporter [Coriobacteriia bacterium]